MSTISTEERREVATRLRKAIGLTEFAEALGFDWTDDSDWGWNDVSNLVADLIESSCDAAATHTDATATCDVSQCRRSDVDRDALLALADELGREADWRAEKYGRLYGSERLWSAARRIREALGVTCHADA